MLRIGTVILSVWCWLNIIPGIGSLVHIALGKHAPGLQMLFAVEEFSSLELRVLHTVDGIAVIANTLIVLYMVLFRSYLMKNLHDKSAFFILALSAGLLQMAGFWSDSFFLGKNTLVLGISTLMLFAGFSLWAKELLFKKS